MRNYLREDERIGKPADMDEPRILGEVVKILYPM